MLARRQLSVLTFVRDYQLETGGVSPDFDEIAIGVGIKSRGNISDVLSALEERGFIERLRFRARAIRILKPVPKPTAAKGIPIFDADTLQLRGYLP